MVFPGLKKPEERADLIGETLLHHPPTHPPTHPRPALPCSGP
jgi:hypothetical protein